MLSDSGPLLTKLQTLAEQGLITLRPHPKLDLLIANYTPTVQYGWLWTPLIEQCRGLVINKQGVVVARPLPKFYNLDEHNGDLPNEPFEVYEKLDGSLIIVTIHQGELVVASRGMFTSPQADWARAFIKANGLESFFKPGITYLFEAIYPENRWLTPIVVDYGDAQRLVLLAALLTVSDTELPLEAIPYADKAKRYDGLTDLNAISRLNWTNSEGFVVRFQSGLRVKIKFEDYLRLHRLISNTSRKTVWESLSEGRLEELLAGVPDEFYSWVQKVSNEFAGQYEVLANNLQALYASCPPYSSRKQFAQWATQYPEAPMLFCLLDGRDYSKYLWQQLKPKGD